MDQLESKTVTLMKPCHCHGCARKFGKGKRIRKTTWVDAGVFGHTAWCATCDDYWDKYIEYGDEVAFGDVKNCDPEGWEKCRLEIEGE